MLTGNDIRRKFLEYFANQGHTVVESSALVPHDDPTLLFTNAGMVQFKRVFMGEDKRGYVRAATAQRCVRAGGKHNDLENVGYTARHHTFFEMLGNFSFGDYFKEEAIRFAWEFLTRELGLPKDKLWVSVFEEDDEAFQLWEKIEDLPAGHIIRLGEKDNFWAMGDTGPCGPCSEILIDQGSAIGCNRPDCKAGCDCDRYLELWNLVFMQFYRGEDGTLTPLPKPSIDTGMGLERISAVVQGVYSNYDSDIFSPLIETIAGLAGKAYGSDERLNTAMRVIADHGRATAFLVADGVLPANEGRGYVLRRLMRRAIRYGRVLGFDRPFLAAVTGRVIELMAGAYPHLSDARELLARVVNHEEERFLTTIDNGIEMLQREIDRMRAAGETVISGTFMFKLYDTHGFPVDVVRDVALEQGFTIDDAGYRQAMAEQRQQSRKSWKAAAMAELGEGARRLAASGARSLFVGYDTTCCEATVTALLDAEGREISRAGGGEPVVIVCDRTPFYAESGGQAGDHGEIRWQSGRAEVVDTVLLGDGLYLHKAQVVEGLLTEGESVTASVAEGRRTKIAGNHTATHLLHAALRGVLGEHVKQAGSLVEPERLRFDFSHFSALTTEELLAVEDWVNRQIRANVPMATALLGRDEAKQSGAMALFGEKYGETVRVVSIGDISRELCGGTHVPATGDIGLFRIVSENGISAGVRRIEAVTGQAALDYSRAAEAELASLAAQLKTSPADLGRRIARMVENGRRLEAEVAQLSAKLSLADLDSLIAAAPLVAGVKVIGIRVALDSPKTLREIGDRIREKMGSAVAVLGGEFQGKAALLVLVSQDLAGRCPAGRVVKEVAAVVGGTGGGRPEMAQAGGPLVEKLDAALAGAPAVVAAILGAAE
ncbi:MAG: alanine--tRNA ligase [Thermodesulfobacteriota bacterium]